MHVLFEGTRDFGGANGSKGEYNLAGTDRLLPITQAEVERFARRLVDIDHVILHLDVRKICNEMIAKVREEGGGR